MFLMNLAWARGAHCVLENPPGSRIWAMLRAARAVCALECIANAMCCTYSEELVGDRLWKRYRLLRTEPWWLLLQSYCTCNPKQHVHVTTNVFSPNGRRRYTGRRQLLLQSAAYPTKLGETVVKMVARGACRCSHCFLPERRTFLPQGTDYRAEGISHRNMSRAGGNCHQTTTSWRSRSPKFWT